MAVLRFWCGEEVRRRGARTLHLDRHAVVERDPDAHRAYSQRDIGLDPLAGDLLAFPMGLLNLPARVRAIHQLARVLRLHLLYEVIEILVHPAPVRQGCGATDQLVGGRWSWRRAGEPVRTQDY